MRGWRVVVVLIAATACGGQGTDLRDMAQTDGGGEAAVNGEHTAFTDPFAGAPAYAKPTKGGTSHNAGRSCGDKSCHGGGGEGPTFLIGGTIYADYTGTQPAVGAEIRIVDTKGNAASAYSDSVGNFYIKAGSTNVALPANVGARNDTTQRPMITQLTGGMGSCGQASCHEHPANPQAYDPIHIP